jgi:hypothetical protein
MLTVLGQRFRIFTYGFEKFMIIKQTLGAHRCNQCDRFAPPKADIRFFFRRIKPLRTYPILDFFDTLDMPRILLYVNNTVLHQVPDICYALSDKRFTKYVESDSKRGVFSFLSSVLCADVTLTGVFCQRR